MGQPLSGPGLTVLMKENQLVQMTALLLMERSILESGEDVLGLTGCAVMGPNLYMIRIGLHHHVLGVGQYVMLLNSAELRWGSS